MIDLDPDHHFFRHIKATWMDGDFVDPAAFRLRNEADGELEDGLSVNWCEYFEKFIPKDAVQPLREVLVSEGRTVGKTSKFALLNVRDTISAAAKYVPVRVAHDGDEVDSSHSLVIGYEAFNDQVAEEIAKVVLETFPAHG
jgi:hypothetical protein